MMHEDTGNQRYVTSVVGYLSQIAEINSIWPQRSLAFRGQQNSAWLLESSAERRLKSSSTNPSGVSDDLFIKYHEDLINKCRLNNFDRRNNSPLHDLELLAELQHYQAATCLIDFTLNSLIALWFASTPSATNGKVFVINTVDEDIYLRINSDDIGRHSIRDILEFKTRRINLEGDALPPTSVRENRQKTYWIWNPANINERILAQHSLFIFPFRGADVPNVKQILIASESKAEIRKELEEVHDIREESLFPDFAGFAYTQRPDAAYLTADAQQHYNSGIAALQRGDSDAAINSFDSASNAGLRTIDLYLNRGDAHRRIGSWNLALNDFNVYLDNIDNNPIAYYYRAVTYAAMNLWNDAVEDFNAAINLNPEFHQAYAGRAFSFYKNGDRVSAMHDFNKAISLYDNDFYYNGRGVIYFENKQFEKALREFDKAVELNPTGGHAYFNRALGYINLKKYTEARRNLSEATSRGLNVANIFLSNFGSVDDYESKFDVKVPDSIRTLIQM